MKLKIKLKCFDLMMVANLVPTFSFSFVIAWELTNYYVQQQNGVFEPKK
jgi:hypothetical protein